MTAPVLARKARPGEPGYPGGRVYDHPRTHEAHRSITAAISILDKPALKFWAARECATFAADHLGTLTQMERDEVIRLVRNAPFEKKEHDGKSAAEIGDIVHDAIDQYIKVGKDDIPEDWPLTAKRMFREFLDGFVVKYRPEFIDSEFTVWSEQYGYAGTGDFLAKIGSYMTAVDTKTGKGIYPEVGLQVAAITNSDYIIRPNGDREYLPRIDREAVFHCRPTFSRLHPLNTQGCFQAFTDCLRIAEWRDKSDQVIQETQTIKAKEMCSGL